MVSVRLPGRWGEPHRRRLRIRNGALPARAWSLSDRIVVASWARADLSARRPMSPVRGSTTVRRGRRSVTAVGRRVLQHWYPVGGVGLPAGDGESGQDEEVHPTGGRFGGVGLGGGAESGEAPGVGDVGEGAELGVRSAAEPVGVGGQGGCAALRQRSE